MKLIRIIINTENMEGGWDREAGKEGWDIQLVVWDYVFHMQGGRNKLVHGEEGTSCKWKNRALREAEILMESKSQIRYQVQHLLDIDLWQLSYKNLKAWIRQMKDDTNKEK